MARRKRKQDKQNGNKFVVIISLIILVLILAVFVLLPGSKEQSGRNIEGISLELAIPQFTKSTKSQIIEHVGYTVSYNEQRRNPNWVAYELTAQEVAGTEPRGDDFVPDPMVVGRQATTDDYKRSGWDRGHLAPAADMKWSDDAMAESFYMSNISPQNQNLNRGVWKSIEELVRENASRHGKLLVVTGPVFTNKKGLGYIGDNRVLIPNGFYKVLLAYDGEYTGIGFYCENVAGKKKLTKYARTIDEIEELAGIDFFHMLPDEIETAVESCYQEYEWGL